MIISILAFLLVLGILVFVHELGHFALAKLTGMRVDEFAIGFPPRLFGIKKGETLYALNVIPLGGYVKIYGENAGAQSPGDGSFQHKSLGARIAVIVAGVVMNLLFALVVLSVAFSIGFVSSSQHLETQAGTVVQHSDVLIIGLLEGSPADRAGFLPGDRIIQITDPQGSQVQPSTEKQILDFTRQAQAQQHYDLKVTLQRDNQTLVKPISLNHTGVPMGAGIEALYQVRVPFWRAPLVAGREILTVVQTTWGALSSFAVQLFGHAHLDQNVSGPVGIYKATSSAAAQGAIPLIYLTVVLSVNLALLNILPIPALDGGRLLFLVIELIFRKRVISEHIENMVTTAGMALLLLLISIITVKDIIRFF